MAIPLPPTAGEPIAEAWGDVVHGAVVEKDIQAGSGSTTGSEPLSNELAITFPRPFGEAPVCIAVANNVHWNVSVVRTTPTQITVQSLRDGGKTGVMVHWLCYGKRA